MSATEGGSRPPVSSVCMLYVCMLYVCMPMHVAGSGPCWMFSFLTCLNNISTFIYLQVCIFAWKPCKSCGGQRVAYES